MSGKVSVIVCHDAIFGPPHELRDYMLRHGIQYLVFIGHVNKSLSENPIQSSYIEIYKKGKLKKRVQLAKNHYPEAVGYIVDSFMTLFWTIKYCKIKIDFFIGLGNLNAIWGILLKLLGRVNNTIYYVIDYNPNRFCNSLMNVIYQYLDYLSAQFSTATWNYAEGMVNARVMRWKHRFPHQYVVPNGITMKKNLPGFSSYNPHELIYIGTLSVQQGIIFVINCLRKLIKEIPDLHLTVIGMGNLREQIERKVKFSHLEKHVRLTGFISDPYHADCIVSQAALGVAMYVPNTGSVAYTEPGKIKRYLSCSVPVIMTDVSPLAKTIEKEQCGIKCVYQQDEFVEKVTNFLRDKDLQKLFRRNAIQFGRKFDWENVFTKSFQELTNTL